MARAATRHAPAKPGFGVQGLIGLTAIVALLLFAAGGITLLDTQNDGWVRAEQGAANLSVTLTRKLGDDIAGFDRALRAVAAAYPRPEPDRSPPDARQLAQLSQFFSARIDILNANGDLIASSDPTQPLGQSFAARDYFETHWQRNDAGLFVSRAIQASAQDRQASLVFSRRLARQDGTFAGVAAASVPLSAIQALFDNLDLGPSGSATIIRSDGRVIARTPQREQDIDRNLGDTPAFKRVSAADSGIVVATAALDGVERLYTFRHVPGSPLIVSVGTASNDIFDVWWRRATAIAAILTLLCAATVVLCVALGRERGRRVEAETTLRGATVQLAMTAATDGLTGLVNQKAFEDRLDREWQRAVRSGTTISLLLMDVDYFKEYNDRYGHAEGDQVLRAIAGCIKANLLRPGDIAARYSGGTFMTVMPETDALGAAIVAERIRTAVAGLSFSHPGTQQVARITISSGLAVASPAKGGDTQRSLMARAEDGMREAKRSGRNRVSSVEKERTGTAQTFGHATRRPG
jgi:diguanylate cyclase (GGDEF)-like protein